MAETKDGVALTRRERDSFISRVRFAGPDECWEWTGALTEKGYGRVHIRRLGGIWKAHRLSYAYHVAPIPDGLWVLHSCDNPPCVNPAHLSLGTVSDNHDDMVKRGRALTGRRNPNYRNRVCARGEESTSAKLTTAQALDIIARREAGESFQSIASLYGIHRNTAARIFRGERWSHLRSGSVTVSPPDGGEG